MRKLSTPKDKFWQRLLLFLFSIPFFFVIIFLLPHFHHLVLTVFCVVGTLICVRELWTLSTVQRPRHWWSVGGVGALFPIGAYFENWGLTNIIDPSFTIAAVFIIALVIGIFGIDRHESLTTFTLEHIGTTIFMCCYPGLFISYIVRIADISEASWVLLTFFTAVYGSDVAGYVAGKLAHGRTKLGLPPSSSKTIIGYIASMITAMISLIIAQKLYQHGLSITIFTALGLGLSIGIASSLGDLLESAIKRAANVKDSGNLIPGRGGLLDSVDSLLISAPIFYLWMRNLV